MEQFAFEVLDNYMRLQESSNDRHIRMVLEFRSFLDISSLRRAVRRSFTLVPILGSRLVCVAGKYHWESGRPGDCAKDDCDVQDQRIGQVSLENILSVLPDPEEGPQIRITVLRQKTKDALVLVVNHMAFDGIGLKEYAYLLARLYNDECLGIRTTLEPSQAVRSLDSIFQRFTVSKKIFLLLQRSESPKVGRPFFSETVEPTSPRILTHKISEDGYSRILAFCRSNRVTVNDFLLAAFVKGIFEKNAYVQGEALTVSSMVDLRRYGPNLDLRFGNFASMMSFSICRDRQDASAIAKIVREKTLRLKSKYPGLKDVFLLDRLSKIIPKDTLERILIKRIKSAGVSSSNLGVIDAEKLKFYRTNLDDAYMTTSLKIRPGLQLAFSTFRESMTLSFSGHYSTSDCEIIKGLIENIASDLNSSPAES